MIRPLDDLVPRALVGVIASWCVVLSGCSIDPAPTTDPSVPTDPPATAADSDAADVDWVAIVTEFDRLKQEAQRDASLDAISEFCAADSPCLEQWTESIQYLIDNDVRVVGGRPDEIVSVSYMGTVDEVPFSQALGVVLDIRQVATEQGTVQLLTADGTLFQELQPDEETPPGTSVDEFIALQRETPTSEWRIYGAVK